jgi:hypothetical protein
MWTSDFWKKSDFGKISEIITKTKQIQVRDYPALLKM